MSIFPASIMTLMKCHGIMSMDVGAAVAFLFLALSSLSKVVLTFAGVM